MAQGASPDKGSSPRSAQGAGIGIKQPWGGSRKRRSGNGAKNRRYKVKRITIIFIVSWTIFSCSSATETKSKIAFTLGGQDKTTISIIVSPTTTKDELKSLIFEFKTARADSTLSKMIPPTTRRGAFGDYAIVWIFVFSEPEWASRNNLIRFVDASPKNPDDNLFSQEFVKHIRAEYYYSMSSEYGSLGYNDGTLHNDEYEKLF